MTICRECGQGISSLAELCPGCGCPKPVDWTMTAWGRRPRHGPMDGSFVRLLNNLTEIIFIAVLLAIAWMFAPR